MSSPRAIALLLTLATLLAWLPATKNGFVNYDDDVYVTQNAIVQKGFTLAGIKWAFTTFHASNWHPLTWLSHMADCELFRLNPGGHHLVSILFHAANAVLLFALIWRLTGALWPGAFVAALFAWHPLHVESVAWISERKDVLSTFFALLTLLSYARFAKESKVQSPKSKVFYTLALLAFALGLMSKPMLVTLPFVMLLLDYWPLKRVTSCRLQVEGSKVQRFQPATFNLQLVTEKFPFFLLSAGSCIVTFLAQKNSAVASFATVPLSLRFENAIVAYAGYLWKTVWPANLAIFYPLPKNIAWPTVTAAAAILFFISSVVWFGRKRSPYLLVGWLWFLGTLVPVIGLVQVGDQAMADRYTYFPLIGIFLAVAFLADDCARRFCFLRIPISIAAVLILAMCLFLTEKQLRYWRDSESLFTHALEVTNDNALAHLNLGAALEEKNETSRALMEYQKALQLNPGRHEIYNNIGKLLDGEGKPQEALPYCRDAVRLDPKSARSHNVLGIVLLELGRFDEATGEFSEAMRLDSNYAPPHFEMGRALLEQGRDADALPEFREALLLEPENFQMLICISRILAADEKPEIRNGTESLALANNAVKLNDNFVALDTLAIAYAENGRFDEAVQTGQQALALALAAGSKDDATSIQRRLELYRKRQPWRESFRKD
jgi:tetratricopeptide (TPR) repeat protein